jgi:hypothetical protein
LTNPATGQASKTQFDVPPEVLLPISGRLNRLLAGSRRRVLTVDPDAQADRITEHLFRIHKLAAKPLDLPHESRV